MNHRILIAVVLTIVIYGIWSWWSVRSEEGFAPFDINSQNYMSAEVEEPPVYALPKQTVPGGPSSPAVAPERPEGGGCPVVLPEESPFDPQEQSYESAELPERLRHPERLYSPGLINENTTLASESGVANKAASITHQSMSQFGPEFAQNGGLFMENGVIANDSTVSSSYSSI
jgi:hypothetical protein